MLRNYLVTAIRSLMKNKSFSMINILGMIFSLAICLLVITIIINVNKSDNFNEKKDRIYRVQTIYSDKYFQNQEFATSPVPLLYKLKNDFPQIEKVVHLRKLDGNIRSDYNELNFTGLYANPEFFESFSYYLKAGDYSDLNEPFKVFLTESFADKMFKDDEVVGKSIYINNLGLFEIKGIIKEPEFPSHLRFELLASAATLLSLEKESKCNKFSDKWTNIYQSATYVLVKPNSDITKIEKEINKVANENYSSLNNLTASFRLQPLISISPGKIVNNEIGFVIQYELLIGLSFIAILILSITGFNYFNLSLAKSLSKYKEIGIRKILGSGRKHIILQYIFESVIILIVSFILSTLVYSYIYKLLSHFESTLSSELLLERSNVIYIIFFLFTIIIGAIFGLVTSLNISKSNPIKVFNNANNSKNSSRFVMRKILITSQFIISTTFIILTILIFKQFNSIINKDYGFDKTNLISINLQGVSHEIFTNEISSLNHITNISSAYKMPINFGKVMTKAVLPNSADTIYINMMNINHNFLEILNINLVAGRNFYPNDGLGNEKYILVNETCTKNMGFKNPPDAIGETIRLGKNDVEIIGVTKDFYFDNPVEEIEQLILRYRPNDFKTVIVKYDNNADVKELISDLEKKWKEIDPTTPFAGEVYNETIKQLLKPLKFVGIITTILSLFAIIISCLGLLGIVSYNSESSKKEIGIRKVMGATSFIIIKHLSKSYLILVSISLVISLVIIKIVAELIKQELPNSIGFDIPSITFGIGIIIFITIATILSQTYNASRRNPIDALRYE